MPKGGLRLGIALSGGGDSVALVHLAAEWAAVRGAVVEAYTFDHGLRAGSAEEVRFCADLCRRLGLRHDSSRWDGPGRGNLQAGARDARRQALLRWAAERGLDALALGHTADDQAETFLMHLARGSGVDGLSGMAEHEQDGGLALLRPLLGQRRPTLRAYLHARGIAWRDDPSNLDPRFARVRARAALEALAPLGLDVERLSRTADRMRLARTALEQATRERARLHAQLGAAGEIVLAPGWDDAPQELAERLLSAALCALGGQVYRPRLSALREGFAALRQGRRFTLHGCVIRPARDGGARLTREEAACARAQPALSPPWDGRWHLDGPALSESQSLGALGRAGLAEVPGWRACGHSSAALAATPAIREGGRIVAAPLAGFGGNWRARLVIPGSGKGAAAIFD